MKYAIHVQFFATEIIKPVKKAHFLSLDLWLNTYEKTVLNGLEVLNCFNSLFKIQKKMRQNENNLCLYGNAELKVGVGILIVALADIAEISYTMLLMTTFLVLLLSLISHRLYISGYGLTLWFPGSHLILLIFCFLDLFQFLVGL